jgi:hypothetical protein
MITDHTFRSTRTGNHNTPFGTCAWNGTCGRPPEEHAQEKESAVTVGSLWLEGWPNTPPGIRNEEMTETNDRFDGPRRLRLSEQLDAVAESLQSPEIHLPELVALLNTLYTWRTSPQAWRVVTRWIHARGDL